MYCDRGDKSIAIPGGKADNAQHTSVASPFSAQTIRLGVRHLDRETVGTQGNVFFFPCGMQWAFGIGVSRCAVLKFEHEGGAEIARFQALSFHPDVLDT